MNQDSTHAAGLIVEVRHGSAGLAALRADSERMAHLAEAALEANPFLCPWFLLAALESFATATAPVVVLVRQPSTRKGPGPIVGLFPLVARQRLRGLPLFRCWSLWQHDYNYLGVPLVHRDHGPACLDALFAWLRQAQPGAGVLELPYVPAEGPFAHLLIETLRRWDRVPHVAEVFTRALLQPDGRDAETYLRAALNSKRRSEINRQEKKLGELGPVTYRTLTTADDVGPWIEQFLSLEQAGWKGAEGTAFASKADHAGFLRAMLTAGHQARALRMIGLFVGDRAIALKCNLHSGAGAVAFKIAYDESLAKFSPGVLLEVENLRQFCGQTASRWMDSCAVPDHPMINRLWTERRSMQTVLIPTGRMPGELLLAALPAMRWVKRLFKRRPNPISSESPQSRGSDASGN